MTFHDLRHDGGAREQPLKAPDDDLIARLHPTALDLGPSRRPDTDRHLAAVGFSILDDPDVGRALNRQDRVLRHDEGVGTDVRREARLDEHPRLEPVLGIRDPRLDEDGARRQLDHRVHEHHLTREIPARQRRDLEAHQLPAAQPVGIALGHLEAGVLRIHRL